jgi:hypothetical protein
VKLNRANSSASFGSLNSGLGSASFLGSSGFMLNVEDQRLQYGGKMSFAKSKDNGLVSISIQSTVDDSKNVYSQNQFRGASEHHHRFSTETPIHKAEPSTFSNTASSEEKHTQSRQSIQQVPIHKPKIHRNSKPIVEDIQSLHSNTIIDKDQTYFDVDFVQGVSMLKPVSLHIIEIHSK